MNPGAGALGSSGGNVLNLVSYTLTAAGAPTVTISGASSANAISDVNLATGKIDLLIDAGPAFSTANANGGLDDLLTFTNSTTVDQFVTVNFSVDGIMSLAPGTNSRVFGQLGFGAAGFLFDTNLNPTSYANGWAGSTIASTGTGHTGAAFSGTYLLAPGQTNVGIFTRSSLKRFRRPGEPGLLAYDRGELGPSRRRRLHV